MLSMQYRVFVIRDLVFLIELFYLLRRRRPSNICLTCIFVPVGLGAFCAPGAQRRTKCAKENIRLKQLLAITFLFQLSNLNLMGIVRRTEVGSPFSSFAGSATILVNASRADLIKAFSDLLRIITFTIFPYLFIHNCNLTTPSTCFQRRSSG